MQSRCRRTARFWWAALSRNASADRRATTSPGSMPRPAWLIRSTRTRTVLSIQSRCRRTARFWWAAFSRSIGGQTRNHIARLDATTGLADSFNPNANDLVYSIAVQADGKILVGGDFRPASADRRATTSPGSIPPPAWLIRSTRTRTVSCQFNRGAGGRQDSSGRRISRQHRRTDAQSHRPARCHDRLG